MIRLGMGCSMKILSWRFLPYTLGKLIHLLAWCIFQHHTQSNPILQLVALSLFQLFLADTWCKNLIQLDQLKQSICPVDTVSRLHLS